MIQEVLKINRLKLYIINFKFYTYFFYYVQILHYSFNVLV